MNPPVVLTVAGTDSGGAAGVAADLTTIAARGAHGACVVTAVTAQDTLGVRDVHAIPVATVDRQLDAVLDDLPVSTAKTGMLGSAEVVELVAERLCHVPLVVDPVLVATSGAVLGDAEVVRAYRELLLPRAAVATPNRDEARALTGEDAPAEVLAGLLAGLGCAVVVTGGLDGADGADGADCADSRTDGLATCTDWVARPGQPAVPLRHAAVDTANDHGTGCTFSAALATELSHGRDLVTASARAAAYTTGQLRLGRGWSLGRGRGPVAHVPSREPDGYEWIGPEGRRRPGEAQ